MDRQPARLGLPSKTSLGWGVEAGAARRIGYQLGALLSPLVALRPVRALGRAQIGLLADGPGDAEREREPHVVVVEIDCVADWIVDWVVESIVDELVEFPAAAVPIAVPLNKKAPAVAVT